MEWSRSLNSCYFNARSLAAQAWPIRLEVQKVQYDGDRHFTMHLQWESPVPVPASFVPFLHFCNQDNEIVFQASCAKQPAVSGRDGTWQVTAQGSLPEKCKPGETYVVCYGLYEPSTGNRLDLAGPDLGDRRIRLGNLQLDGQDNQLTNVSWTAYDWRDDPVLRRQNYDDRMVDFGPVATNSGCRLTLDHEQLLVTPLPGTGHERFQIEIHWDQLPWTLKQPSHVAALDESGQVLERQPLRFRNGSCTIVCDGATFAYRLED